MHHASLSLGSQSYDAGNVQTTGFNPEESLRAFRAALPNAAVAIGIEVGRGSGCPLF